jgi:hypothetical protein
MGASTNLVPISIIYTSIVIYLYFYKITPSLNNPNIPNIVYLIGLLALTHSIYASIISIYSSKSECGRYSVWVAIKSSLTMLFWLLVPIGILFFTSIFTTPFYNIWGYNIKSDTIAYSFFLSLFTSLVAIVIYYNSKMDICVADANVIDRNVKQLDEIFNKDEDENKNEE